MENTSDWSKNDINNAVKNNLENGKPVIVHVLGAGNGGESTFTPTEHWMAIMDIDLENNRVYLSNPNSYGESGWIDIDKVLTSVEDVILCT